MLENKYYKDAENIQIILELGCRNESLLLSIALHCVCLKKKGVLVLCVDNHFKPELRFCGRECEPSVISSLGGTVMLLARVPEGSAGWK